MHKPIRKIALISPNPRFPDFEGLCKMAENALPLIGTVLKEKGYDVEVFMERIAPIPWERLLQADLVGFSAVTPSANRCYEMVDKIKAARNIPVILGGPHASMLTEDAVKHFDYVVRGEGEITILELLDALNNKRDIESVRGISYLRRERTNHNPDREYAEKFEIIADLSLIHGYDKLNPLKLFLQGKHHMHFIETSRGCPYPCKFCWRIGMKTVRFRTFETVIKDFKSKSNFVKGIPNCVYVLDSYFGVNKEMTKKLLKEMISNQIKGYFFVFARCEIADDLELLGLMRKVGVKMIFMGVESVNDKNLEFLKKKQTVKKVQNSLKILSKNGFKVVASFILGSDSDPENAWLETVKFAQENDVTLAMFNSLIQFPKSEEMIPSWRVFQKNWDYYNGSFVTFFPLKMKPSQLQEQLVDAYCTFYSYRNIFRKIVKGKISMALHQFYHKITFRYLLSYMRSYVTYLKTVEEGMYDAADHLISFEEETHGKIVCG